MNISDLKKMLCEMKNQLEVWHNLDLTWFELEDYLKFEDSLLYYFLKLGFHNFCTWHLIEGYQDNDPNKVHFVYAGGLQQNKDRNQTIEIIDEKLINFQKGTGKINSETIGSIVDRISVFYIKMLHMKNENDNRLDMVERQTAVLENCFLELFEDMINGERRIAPLSRFKTTGYNV
jgi:hypothetical protein